MREGLTPDEIRELLAAFNEQRRQLLDGKPIDPEGDERLMPPEDME